jgi:hypothetical protein
VAKHQRKGRDVEGSKGWHVFHLAEFSKVRRGFFFFFFLRWSYERRTAVREEDEAAIVLE